MKEGSICDTRNSQMSHTRVHSWRKRGKQNDMSFKIDNKELTLEGVTHLTTAIRIRLGIPNTLRTLQHHIGAFWI